jgi:ankyrin repeat protein
MTVKQIKTNKTTTRLFALAAAMLLTGCESTINKAAERGDAARVQQLLDKGVNLNARSVNWGRLPLICAAKYGHAALVEQLLNKGADLNAVDAQGWTALAIAAYYGHADCVKVLLEHGPNLNQETFGIYLFNGDNQVGKTALQLAREQGYQEIAELIQATSKKSGATTGAAAPPMLLPLNNTGNEPF